MDKQYLVIVGFREPDGKEWKAGDRYEGSDERIAELIKDAKIIEKNPTMQLLETGWKLPPTGED